MYGRLLFRWRCGSLPRQICFFGRIWSLLSNWLRFVTIISSVLSDQLMHFVYLGSFSKQTRLAMNIMTLLCLSHLERKKQMYFLAQRVKNLSTLCEKIEFRSFLWLKARYATFVYEYHYGWFNHIQCLTTIS